MESIARSIGIDVDTRLKTLNLGFQLASPVNRKSIPITFEKK